MTSKSRESDTIDPYSYSLNTDQHPRELIGQVNSTLTGGKRELVMVWDSVWAKAFRADGHQLVALSRSDWQEVGVAVSGTIVREVAMDLRGRLENSVREESPLLPLQRRDSLPE